MTTDYLALYECLKDVDSTRKLLSDPKRTATALLTIKYDILEPREDKQLSFSLKSLCHLLSIHHSAWSVIEQTLVDRIVELAGTESESDNVVNPALSILALMALETRVPRHIAESVMPNMLQSFSRQPEALKVIFQRLNMNSIENVDVVLQFIASMILGLVLSEEGGQSVIFYTMRQSGMWTALSTLIQNKTLASGVRAHLSDLQVLLKNALWDKSLAKGDLSNPLHRQVFEDGEKKLQKYLGTLLEGETFWEKAGIVDEEPIAFFNRFGSWGAFFDFMDFICYENESFQLEYLLHMSFTEGEGRFPLARASTAISNILLDVFNLKKRPASSELEEGILNGESDLYIPPEYIPGTRDAFPFTLSPVKSCADVGPSGTKGSIEDFMKSINNLRPLLFDWTTLHYVGMFKIMKVWTDTKAGPYDFDNLEYLIRTLFIKSAESGLKSSSFSAVDGVIAKLDNATYEDLRVYQLSAVAGDFKKTWSLELQTLYKKFMLESVELVREQRSRQLLKGEWFFAEDPRRIGVSVSKPTSNPSLHTNANKNGTWYFIVMSASRKTLQYNFFLEKTKNAPDVGQLTRSVDIAAISSVVLDVITPVAAAPKGLKRVSIKPRIIYNRIQLVNANGSVGLTFFTETAEKAAAWSDGLLMLKHRAFQTVETKNYIEMFANTKLRLQMLHFSRDETDLARMNGTTDATIPEPVNTDFFFADQ